jgi:hypothetical protein
MARVIDRLDANTTARVAIAVRRAELPPLALGLARGRDSGAVQELPRARLEHMTAKPGRSAQSSVAGAAARLVGIGAGLCGRRVTPAARGRPG